MSRPVGLNPPKSAVTNRATSAQQTTASKIAKPAAKGAAKVDALAKPAAPRAAAEKNDSIASLLHGGDFEFQMVQGPNTNLFLQSKDVTSHVIVSSEPKVRAIASFPAGNSGVAVFADPQLPENAGLTFEGGGLKAGKAPAGAQTASFELTASQQHFVIDQVVMDSLRSVRAVTEGAGRALELLPEQQKLSSAPRIEAGPRGTTLTFERKNLDGKSYELKLQLPKGTKVEVSNGQVKIDGAGKGPLKMTFDATVPYPAMNPLPLKEMIDAKALKRLEQLDPKDPKTKQIVDALRALQFLSFQQATGPDGKAVPYSEKLLAGSWRFETYFGRDTMLTAMMLQDILTPAGLEVALGSVLDRISPEGQVAHEEDIGSFAERRQLLEAKGKGGADAARGQKPIFDYKMIDSDLMLPVLLERYAQTADPARVREVLSKPTPEGGTRLEAVQKNFQFIAKQAAQYDGSPTTLLRIHEGEHVGDWRDSNSGLGGGVYPGSVNIDLVSNALRAMQDVGSRLGVAAGGEVGALLSKWSSANSHFEVTLQPDELRTRLKGFLALPSNAGQLERLLELRLGKDAKGSEVTLGGFLKGATPRSLEQGFSFMALSLDDEGQPVRVPNSDGAMRMFLGDPSTEEIAKMLPALELPYPIGLMTRAGLLTANPAFAQDTSVTLPSRDGKTRTQPLTTWLDRTAYHGSVVWVWPQQMMQLGLMRQIDRLAGDPGATDVVKRMRAVLENLRGATARAGELAGAELYTFDDKGKATALTQAMGSDTEANAAQLWSTVAPAVELAYQRLNEKLVHG